MSDHTFIDEKLFTDARDGKAYKTVTIGEQVWMAENLAYLPSVVGPATGSEDDGHETDPYYYVYTYDGTDIDEAKATNNYQTYGVLYNWPASLTACPEGWHLPSHDEWTTLTDYLGDNAGGKLKEAGFSHWDSPNTGATNESGFTALPGGFRRPDGAYVQIGSVCFFWSSTENDTNTAWDRSLGSDNSGTGGWLPSNKAMGWSVRCIRNNNVLTVTTGQVLNITTTTATCAGNVTGDGGAAVTARGLCWSTSENPTTENSKTTDGTGVGTYTSNITDLSPNTTYYVRAYATNSLGTAYGEQRTFTTKQTTPSVTTGYVTDLTTIKAYCSGNVTSEGGSSVTARGVCWNTSENPTTSNFKTTDGTGVGTYTSTITGLSPNSTYYVRAYATNSEGTAYGEQKTFSTLRDTPIEYGSLTDSRNNKVYKTVTIGDQVWMAENLAYLPSVVGPATESHTDPYYYVYDYDGTDLDAATATENYQTYGALYNWPAAMVACPEGWHLPSDDEWTELLNYLGGEEVASDKMREVGSSHWPYIAEFSNNDLATNGSGFTALPGGNRSVLFDGSFLDLGKYAQFWTSTVAPGSWPWYVRLSNSDIYRNHYSGNYAGFSVRCVRNDILLTVTTGQVTDVTATSAICSGSVTSDGDQNVTSRGVCWSTSENPTTSNSKTTDGTGVGDFTSNLTGLSPNTTYYVSAYATNSEGTAYGEQKSFTTLSDAPIEYGSFTDSRDSKVYKTVTIGEQVWMAENLAYLPSVVGPATQSGTEPYCYVYEYNGTNVTAAKATENYTTYGVLYNWPAAMAGTVSSSSNPSGVQGICPPGWHLPSDDEWTELATFLADNGYNYDGSIGGSGDIDFGVQGKIAKSMATDSGWDHSDNTGAVGNTEYPEYRNKSGFSALPGGYFEYDSFYGIGYCGYWWSSTEYSTQYTWYHALYYNNCRSDRSCSNKYDGYSVRCLQNSD